MLNDDFQKLAPLVALDTVSPLDPGRLDLLGTELRRYGCRPLGDGSFGLGDPGATTWLYSHADTKPATPREEWSTDPWTLVDKDGLWYGLGVSDAKFQLLNALEAAAPGRHFVLVDTCEEYDGAGAAADYVRTHRPDTLVICDGAYIGHDTHAGHLGQVDGELLLDTGRERRHPARASGDVGEPLHRLLGRVADSGLAFTMTGLSAPHTERSLSLQRVALRFDLRYGPSQAAAVEAFLDAHPHRIRQWLHPVTGEEPPGRAVGGPASSASRLGSRGPLGVRQVLVVPGAAHDNRNHQPDEFIRPDQVTRHRATVRRVLAELDNGRGLR